MNDKKDAPLPPKLEDKKPAAPVVPPVVVKKPEAPNLPPKPLTLEDRVAKLEKDNAEDARRLAELEKRLAAMFGV